MCFIHWYSCKIIIYLKESVASICLKYFLSIKIECYGHNLICLNWLAISNLLTHMDMLSLRTDMEFSFWIRTWIAENSHQPSSKSVSKPAAWLLKYRERSKMQLYNYSPQGQLLSSFFFLEQCHGSVIWEVQWYFLLRGKKAHSHSEEASCFLMWGSSLFCASAILCGYKFGIIWKNFSDEHSLWKHLFWHIFSHSNPSLQYLLLP